MELLQNKKAKSLVRRRSFKHKKYHRRVGAIARGIIWVTSKERGSKKDLFVGEMETEHIFNCIKMLFNHSVPTEYRFLGYKPYEVKMTMEQRNIKVNGLLQELALRGNEVTEDMLKELKTMECVTNLLYKKTFAGTSIRKQFLLEK